MHDRAYRELDQLAALRARDVADLQDLRRHMARRRMVVDAAPDPRRQRVIEPHAVAQPHEQHDAHVVLPLLRDHDRLEHVVDLLHCTIDLRGADAHAARVQDGIRAAVDDRARRAP